MKLFNIIAAFLAGIVSFCAYATPIDLSAMDIENDAYFKVEATEGFGLHGFDQMLLERSGFEIKYDEPAIVLQPAPPLALVPLIVPLPRVVVEPADAAQVVFLAFPNASPAKSVGLDPDQSLDRLSFQLLDERVPEPESLWLIGTGLLMLSARRLFWRRGF